MKKINLAIIEDTEDIRLNLFEYFSNELGINCVMCEESIEDFIKNESYNEIPEVILSDVGLPGITGIEGIPLLKKKFPEVDIVLLTVFSESETVFNALCSGAAGYILKGTPLADIKEGIIAVSNGGSYMSPAIARKVINFFMPVKVHNEKLTEREAEIVKALADGLSYKLIADRLSISIDAIRFHTKNIYKKLHVNSKAEVIRKVYRGEV